MESLLTVRPRERVIVERNGDLFRIDSCLGRGKGREKYINFI